MHTDGDRTIGIVGLGVVGSALRTWLESQGRDVRMFDPPKGYASPELLADAAVVFVCVPTPYVAGIGFDDRYLRDAIDQIPGEKIVVIKSTVLPGTTHELQSRYARHRFLFNPEFLREATAYDDLVRPDRQIVGYTAASRSDAERVLRLLPPAPYQIVCRADEAEMAKYVANAFLAVKVSYANEIFDLCGRLGVDYEQVRDIVAADERIGPSHMDVFDGGYRGYGGKCLPKDSKSLLDLARRLGVELAVVRAADRVNAALRMPAMPEAWPAAASRSGDEAHERVA